MSENINTDSQAVVKKLGDTITASELLKIMVDSPTNAAAKKPLTWADVHLALDLFKEAVTQEIGMGHRVQLNGFLSFVLSYRPPRKGNNVITREPMSIPEGIQITAKVGSLVRNAFKNLGPEAIQEFKALSKRNKPPEVNAVENIS